VKTSNVDSMEKLLVAHPWNVDHKSEACRQCGGRTPVTEINKVYADFLAKPYPARACYEVKALPKGAKVEIEAVIALG